MKSRLGNDKLAVTIGQWSFYPEFGRFLNQQGIEFFLDNRLNKLLQILIDKKETIVKRKEIIDYVWGEVIVNEENLTKGIFDLRKLLQEKEVSAIEIKTIRNIGYRLSIKKDKKNPTSKPVLRLVLKSLLYFFLISSFLIMFIRAIRYEN